MGRIFRLALFCFSVFISVLVSLQLYFAVIDEENSFSFSQIELANKHETYDKSEGICNSGKNIFGEKVCVGEIDKLNHFNYGRTKFKDVIFGNPYKYARDNEIPIIIWWTHFTNGNEIHSCSEGKCYITENRALKQDELTKAFLFYGTDFNANDLPLPRKEDHEWGLLHEESPKNNPLLFHEDTIVLFNHTSTFRRHSDYPLTTQYLESINVLENEPWYTLEEKNENGRASVVYVQSGCNPPSDRDAYVQELMKYIKVDSYGRCLNNNELPEEYKDPLTFENKGFFKFVAKYKFTLVFENAICEDYITEKIWRPLVVGSVPIYRGSPKVLDWMPNNHSIILVDDYASPKLLAYFIKKVDTSNSMYQKYLEFKKKNGVTNKRLLEHMGHRPWGVTDDDINFVSGFECFVCDRLHQNVKRQNRGLSSYKYVANQDHFGCPRPVLFDFRPPQGTEQVERDYWGEEYDEYIPVAKDMKAAVLSGQNSFKYSLF